MATIRERITRQVQALVSRGPSPADLASGLASADRAAKIEFVQNAIRATARTSSDAAPDERLAVVQAALERERDVQVVSSLMRALSHWGGRDAGTALEPYLAHTDGRVVSNALESLVLAGGAVAPLVAPLVGHADPRARATALAVLCKLDHDAAVAAVGKFLVASRTPDERQAAVHALRAVGRVPENVLRELSGKCGDAIVAAQLEELRAANMPDSLMKSAIIARSRISQQIRKPLMVRLLGGRGRRLLAAGGLATVVAGLAAGAWWSSDAAGGAPLSALGAALDRARPVAVARAPLAKFEGTKVVWRGTVAQLVGPDAIIAAAGGAVRVPRAAGSAALHAGDTVEITGTIRGRSAMGMVFVEGDVKLLEAARTHGQSPPPSLRTARDLL